MSGRGLILALQRLHDDPGFIDLIAQDPEQTLGLYDMDDQERQALAQAALDRDEDAIRAMAAQAGLDWTAVRVSGPGALDESEVSTEAAPKLGVHGVNAMTGAGYGDNLPSRTPNG